MMFGATPYAVAPYGALVVASQTLVVGEQLQFGVGAVDTRTQVNLYPAGIPLGMQLGQVVARAAADVAVAGMALRFDMNAVGLWQDIPLPTNGMWEDIFPREIGQQTPVSYGASPYAFGAYSGDVLENLTYELAQDAWVDIDTEPSNPWRDVTT